MKFQLGKSYEELEIGEEASFTKTITETDVYLFAGISGDFNPLHVNEEYAKNTPFKQRIAHGALPQSLIAPVLGMKLPGLGHYHGHCPYSKKDRGQKMGQDDPYMDQPT